MPYTNELPAELPPAAAATTTADDGVSIWRSPELRSTMAFVCVPVMIFLVATFLDVDVPAPIVYGIGAVMAPMMFLRVVRDPEWVMAAFILYIPMARMYVFPLGPGMNAMNLLMGAMLLSWWKRAKREDRPMFASMPLTGAIWTWAALSCFSFITALFARGIDEFIDVRLGLIRIWLDQFIVFFTFLNLIRDGKMARRVAIYLCLGSMVVTFCGFAEWIQKGDASSIEKSRLLGPMQQPNDLSAFLAYTSGPFVALFVQHAPKLRMWLLGPYLMMIARVLFGTFSRGGYIAYGIEMLMALSLRGKLFLAAIIAVIALTINAFPEVLPASVMARLNETHAGEGDGAEGLDKSSQTRLILWDAALKMVAESPVFGKGFFVFPFLKAQYTEEDVSESDNHNMYLYIASNMGIPALLSLIVVIWRLYLLSARVYRKSREPWTRAIGMGAATMCCGVAAVNMFGSRMLDITVMGYVWIYAAVISHLWVEVQNQTPLAQDNNDQFSGIRP